MLLQWLDGAIGLRCPVCGRSGEQALVASAVVDWQDEQVQIARCVECGALVMGTVMRGTAHDEHVWDLYIEHTAGLETIDAALAKVGAPPGARVLDVGCGYGFSLDLAVQRFRWRGMGLDPSVVAARGREELGVDIRTGLLDESFSDEPFDIVVAIEMFEHVSDPTAFLADVRRCLTPTGVALITTPDAGAFRPETPVTALWPLLSLGEHVFLVDEDGFRRLLEGAGFHTVVWVRGETLYALASPTPQGLRGTRPDAKPDLVGLIDYCSARARSAVPGSALAVGMSVRAVRFAMLAGMLRRAEVGIPLMRSAIDDRYGVDLDDPAEVAAMAPPPDALVPAHFYTGLVAFHRGDMDRAERHFFAAASVARSNFERYGVYRDPESPLLEAQALEHRVLAIAQCDPDRVPQALEDLHDAVRRSWADPWRLVRYREQSVERLAGSWLRELRLAGERRWRAARAHVAHLVREARARRAIPGRRWSGRRASDGVLAVGDRSE